MMKFFRQALTVIVIAACVATAVLIVMAYWGYDR